MVLVVRIGRLGDFLVALPALRRLRERYTEEQIALLTSYSSSSRVTKIAQGYADENLPPWVNLAFPRYVDKVLTTSGLRSLRGWIALRERLQALGPFHTVYVLGYHAESWSSRWKKRLWLRCMGIWAPLFDQAADAPSGAGQLCSRQVEKPWRIAHAPGCVTAPFGFADLVRVIPKQDLVDRAEIKWHALSGHLRERPRVAIFAGATFEHKRWPEERFAAVARDLVARADACVLFVGAAGDRAVSRRVIDQLSVERVAEACGQTSLEELTALLACADLFVGNDGGLAHLAAAVGLPCVAIMSGIHRAGVWDPSGPQCRSVRVSELSCIGCGAEFHCPAGHRRCILEITTESVLRECHLLLSGRKVSQR